MKISLQAHKQLLLLFRSQDWTFSIRAFLRYEKARPGRLLLPEKVLDQVHTGFLTFLRMELGRDKAASLDRAGESYPVGGHCCVDRLILRLGVVGVDEIKIRIQA